METLVCKKRSAVSASSLLRKIEEWWKSTEFREMAVITGYRQFEFDPEDGYQEFIDACNNYWQNLTAKEKLEKWNLFH
jgi:hypothetical protein